MSTSVRSYLVTGAAAATATAIALAPVQAAPADIAVSAHPISAQPQLTTAMVDLLAAASRMTAAVTPKLPTQSGAAPAAQAAPALGAAPSAAVTGGVGVQNAASDWLTQGYTGIQAWVDWGVEYAQNIAWWLGGWGVPFAGLVGDQIGLFYDHLIRPIANSIFYDLIVPVVNNPLNLAVWANGIGNAIGSSINSGINFGVAEFNYFFGWILPPLPPRPPFPLATVATDTLSAGLAAPLAAPTLRKMLGAIVLPPADFVTDAAVNTIDGAYNVVHNTTGFLVDGADNVLDALRLGLVSKQIDINYKLASSLSNEGVGLTTDLIQVPDRYLNDVLDKNQGILEAVGTEARFVSNSITDHSGKALNAVGNYVGDQINYFTPKLAATDTNTKEVTTVPTTVRESLAETVDSTKDQTQKLTGAITNRGGQTPTKVAVKTDAQSRVQARVKSQHRRRW
ncbi:hypothetical protein [Mycolicibacterium sp. CBMA 295]|uniref:hypothetical protein n=1 Tax=Mycolicibacterium sp. CBMA 295 TaxID=2606605 RepID=UPI0012DC5CBF|nr:hypothetical protein [Mycolicibacterium sp. CBMA 295]MUM28588.1 hypothetical protein [Mycolicibacterium sp. CBMA 295]